MAAEGRKSLNVDALTCSEIAELVGLGSAQVSRSVYDRHFSKGDLTFFFFGPCVASLLSPEAWVRLDSLKEALVLQSKQQGVTRRQHRDFVQETWRQMYEFLSHDYPALAPLFRYFDNQGQHLVLGSDGTLYPGHMIPNVEEQRFWKSAYGQTLVAPDQPLQPTIEAPSVIWKDMRRYSVPALSTTLPAKGLYDPTTSEEEEDGRRTEERKSEDDVSGSEDTESSPEMEEEYSEAPEVPEVYQRPQGAAVTRSPTQGGNDGPPQSRQQGLPGATGTTGSLGLDLDKYLHPLTDEAVTDSKFPLTDPKTGRTVYPGDIFGGAARRHSAESKPRRRTLQQDAVTGVTQPRMGPQPRMDSRPKMDSQPKMDIHPKREIPYGKGKKGALPRQPIASTPISLQVKRERASPAAQKRADVPPRIKLSETPGCGSYSLCHAGRK